MVSPRVVRFAAVVLAAGVVCGAACSGREAPGGTSTVAATADAASPAPSETVTAPAHPTATAITPVSPVPATATPGGPAAVVRTVAQAGVVLTFDAGSDAGYTSVILDTLAGEGIRASFGVTGKWAAANPDLVRRIADEGHSFINHSYDHGSFTGFSDGRAPLTREQRWEQLDDTDVIIRAETGMTSMPYFRPPYGDYDDSVNSDVGARGYRYNVMWTVDSYGWRGVSADEITSRCLELAEPGAIYIFHVGSSSKDGLALPSVIAGLRAAGYGFVSLPDALP